jgi:hypothetical protein
MLSDITNLGKMFRNRQKANPGFNVEANEMQ